LEESDPLRYAAAWWDILFELEDCIGRSVDLVTPDSLTNIVFKEEVPAGWAPRGMPAVFLSFD
jgi:hypothetical protein